MHKELLEDLESMKDRILDPMQRQAAAESLAKLDLSVSELKHRVFNEAQRRLTMYKDLLNSRNVEDDKAIQWHLENFNLKGVRELLGHAPEKDAAENASSKVFHERMARIEKSVRDHLALAKQSILQPEAFAAEFGKLNAAEKEISEYLKLYKDFCRV